MRRNLLLCLLLICVSAQSRDVSYKFRALLDGSYSHNTSTKLGVNWKELNVIGGFQFNPFLFVGAGLGLHDMPKVTTKNIYGDSYTVRKSRKEIPVFANVRFTMLKSRLTPFVDFRLGGNIKSSCDVYVSTGLGFRYSLRRFGLYGILSYSSHKLEFKNQGIDERHYTPGVTARIGIDVQLFGGYHRSAGSVKTRRH